MNLCFLPINVLTIPAIALPRYKAAELVLSLLRALSSSDKLITGGVRP